MAPSGSPFRSTMVPTERPSALACSRVTMGVGPQVDVEQPIERLRVELVGLVGDLDAGVVDQEVDGAELALQLFAHALVTGLGVRNTGST